MSIFSATQIIPNALRFYLTGRRTSLLLQRPVLSELARLPQTSLPPLIQESATALKYLQLFSRIDWTGFPAHLDQRIYFDFPSSHFVLSQLLAW